MDAEIKNIDWAKKSRESCEERDALLEANKADAKERGFRPGSFNQTYTVEPSKERAHENPPEELRAPPLARGGLQPYPQNINVSNLGDFDTPTNNKPEVKTIKNKEGWEYSGWSKPPKNFTPDPQGIKELTERQIKMLNRRKK
ncbi:hypothetical protein SynBIOSU31_02095 [Synechococcus sp. BIOS-U3-1]|uniref:hypothetical protein n=1 Tax=Synechococcus sp. BIOS-U3-1 TaxID=1400865 RepID=UPI001645CD0F|nr:hypothetical protein [Synechococcus sp. BIOS-U3-1]QNI58961.1 hypothetical protein SynBIOSU31_02095 [Synechococcus sp. BIOS-U3-1]